MNKFYFFIIMYYDIFEHLLKISDSKYFNDLLLKDKKTIRIIKTFKGFNKEHSVKSDCLNIGFLYDTFINDLSESKQSFIKSILFNPYKPYKIVKINDGLKSFLGLNFLFLKNNHNKKVGEYSVFFDVVKIKLNITYKVLCYSVVRFDRIDTYLIFNYQSKGFNDLLQLKNIPYKNDSIGLNDRDKKLLKQIDSFKFKVYDLSDILNDILKIESDIEILTDKKDSEILKLDVRQVKKLKRFNLNYMSSYKHRDDLKMFKSLFSKNLSNKKTKQLDSQIFYKEKRLDYLNDRLVKNLSYDKSESVFKTLLFLEKTEYKDLSLYDSDLLE